MARFVEVKSRFTARHNCHFTGQQWEVSIWEVMSGKVENDCPTVSRWFCPSRPYCGMNSAHSWHTVLVREHVSRTNGMRCFTSQEPVSGDWSAPSGLDQLSMSCIDLFTKVEIEG